MFDSTEFPVTNRGIKIHCSLLQICFTDKPAFLALWDGDQPEFVLVWKGKVS
jgi:hypothetical protein